jgi:hypothetical protein
MQAKYNSLQDFVKIHFKEKYDYLKMNENLQACLKR